MTLKRHFKCLHDISCFKEKFCCTLTHAKQLQRKPSAGKTNSKFDMNFIGFNGLYLKTFFSFTEESFNENPRNHFCFSDFCLFVFVFVFVVYLFTLVRAALIARKPSN